MLVQTQVVRNSWNGLQAWMVSVLIHASLLALMSPFFRDISAAITPEPFRLTINLVESFSLPSQEMEGPAIPSNSQKPGLDHPISEDHSSPLRPSKNDSHDSKSAPQLMAANLQQASPHLDTTRSSFPGPVPSQSEDSSVAEQTMPSEKDAVPRPHSLVRALPEPDSVPSPVSSIQQDTASVPEVAPSPEPSAATKLVTARDSDADQSRVQAIEPTPLPSLYSSARPTQIAPLEAPILSGNDAPAPTPLPTVKAFQSTRSKDDVPPLVAARLPVASPESSFSGEPDRRGGTDAARRDAVSAEGPMLTRARVDYDWLQLALSHRLDELKRSSRPLMEESGMLRVLLKAVVSNTGELLQAEILTSSGQRRIDQEAMTLIQRAFPMSLEHDLDRPSIAMRIPVTFSRN